MNKKNLTKDETFLGNPSKEQVEHGDKVQKHNALVKDVRETIGSELMAKLAAQPTGMANGGAEAILQRACSEAAGFPDPVATAVAKFRVLCGSRAVPKPLNK